MQNLIIATMTIGYVAASNTVASASDFLCSNYVQSTSAVFTSGGELTSKTDHGLNAITMLAIGAYLADKKVVFSEASTDVQTDAFKNFYLYCQKNPDELAVDAAINAVIRVNMKPAGKPTTQVQLVDASPLKITADEIAKAISDKKTELEQEAWWAETMSGKTYQLTGKVSEVETGTFSGYWVNLDIGRNIMVRCGMSSAGEATVKSLKKGQQFTCKGVVSSTWTSIFGTTFQVDAG